MRANDSSGAAQALGFGESQRPMSSLPVPTEFKQSNYSYKSSFVGGSRTATLTATDIRARRTSSSRILELRKNQAQGHASSIKETYIPISKQKVENDFTKLRPNQITGCGYQTMQGSFNQAKKCKIPKTTKAAEKNAPLEYKFPKQVDDPDESMSCYKPLNYPFASQNYEAPTAQPFQEKSQNHNNINKKDAVNQGYQNENLNSHFRDPNEVETNIAMPVGNESYLRTPPKENSPPKAWAASELPS